MKSDAKPPYIDTQLLCLLQIPVLTLFYGLFMHCVMLDNTVAFSACWPHEMCLKGMYVASIANASFDCLHRAADALSIIVLFW